MKYTIKEGKHYSNWTLNRLLPFTKLKRKGHIKFNRECWYNRESVEHTGWNKLTGIAQAFGVHQNSGRLVWQPDFKNFGVIKIAGYVYSNGGDWKAVEFVDVQTDRWYPYEIEYSGGRWLFHMNYRFTSMSGAKPKLPVKCYPYFGGKSTAPYTMQIEIR